MVQASSAGKNIWVAASDGDLERVQYLIESEGQSPNVKDSNSYSPMHAAASYAHLELLTYLISKGGNVNLTDDDGETPLFVIENEETARFLLQNGADLEWKNEEGLTAAEVLAEDNPELSTYLQSLSTSTSAPVTSTTETQEGEGLSQLALENYTSSQSNALMEQATEIMRRAHERGEDPDEALRELVEKAVRDGLLFGATADGVPAQDDLSGDGDGEDRKRARE